MFTYLYINVPKVLTTCTTFLAKLLAWVRDGVTFGSGRDERRLKYQGDRGSFEGHLQGTQVLGTSAAALSNDWLRKRFKGLFKERTLESSVKTLRSLKVKGELSRFKLRKSTRDVVYLNT